MKVSKRPKVSGLYFAKRIKKGRIKGGREIVRVSVTGGQVTEIQCLGHLFSEYVVDYEPQWIGPFTVDQLLLALIKKGRQ